MEHRVITDYTNVNTENANVKVYVRARPPQNGDSGGSFMQVDRQQPKKLTFSDPVNTNKHYGQHAFMFDRVFWADAHQEEVFNVVCKPQVHHVLNGYNACCFAYGQTGSGKTYSMFGGASSIRGMIPRSVEYLFQCLTERSSTFEVAMVCSFLEIYCDEIRDLGKAYLVSSGFEQGVISVDKTSDLFDKHLRARQTPFNRPTFSRPPSFQSVQATTEFARVLDEYTAMNYEIHEDTEGTVFVKDLALIPVTTVDEVMVLINMGLSVRATHETKMNSVSSRSHTVFTITVVQRDKSTGQATTAMLNLVDLAGSERIKKSESQGSRLREALHINTSLSALGKVVIALDPTSAKTHIPYRDSKLTRLLQNSLGGNSYTTLLATIHPDMAFADECLSTLQFANRCRNVRNNPRVNYVGTSDADKSKQLKRMAEEVAMLRQKLAQLEQASHTAPKELVQALERLGIDTSCMENGEIRLPDGTLVNLTGEAPILSLNTRYPLSSSDPKTAVELGRALRHAEDEQRNAKLKLQQRKETIDKLEHELKTVQQTQLQSFNTWKRREQALHDALTESELIREKLMSALSTEHSDQIRAVLGHNTTILEQQHALLNSVPENLQVNSGLLRDARGTERQAREKLTRQHRAQMDALETGHVAQLDMLKQQYEYWLQEKDDQLKAFAEGLDVYRKKYQTRFRVYEEEMVRLYDFAAAAESLLQKVEKGQLPIQSCGTAAWSSVFPRQLRQSNILQDAALLEHTLRAVKTRNGTQQDNQELHNQLLEHIDHTVSVDLKTAIASLVKAPQDRPTPAKSFSHNGNSRPTHQKRRKYRPASAPWSHSSESMVRTNSEECSVNSPCSPNSKGVQMSTFADQCDHRPGAHDDPALVGKPTLEQQILAELASHPTVEYIRNLEDERDNLRAQLRENNKVIHQLKVANISLQRQVRKSSQTSMPHGWHFENAPDPTTIAR